MKYNISKECGIYRRFSPPICKPMLYLAKVCLSIMPKGMHSDKYLDITKVIVPSGSRQFSMYIIKPRGVEKNRCIVYYHGGGFVFKGAPYHYKLAKIYAKETRSTVIL